MRVSDLFAEAKRELDAIFGEGYAVANPVLVDRYVQQAFRSRGRAVEHHEDPPRFAWKFESAFAPALQNGRLASSIEFARRVDAQRLYEAVATDLGVECTHGFRVSCGRFVAHALNAELRRSNGTRYYKLPDLDEVVTRFRDTTGCIL